MQPLIAILAAGRGARFGCGKLLANLVGKPLGLWALDAAAGTGHPIAWIGNPEVNPIAAGRAEVFENPHPERGLSRSLAIAVQAAESRSADALLIMLADMPLITSALLNQLIACGAPSACSHPGGIPGVPALFPAHMYSDLKALTGDQGAGRLLGGLAELGLVAVSSEVLLDVDSSGDLGKAARLLESGLQNGLV